MGWLCAGAVEVRNELSRSLGLDLPATVLFDYPTIDALSSHLASLVDVQSSSSLPAPAPVGKHGAAPQAVVSSGSIEQQVMSAVHRVAGRDAAPDTPLAAAGVDSLAAVELRNELCRCVSSFLCDFLVS